MSRTAQVSTGAAHAGAPAVDTRRVLLRAAYHEIHAAGFQAASLTRILDQAGLTKGALYYHFASKRELGYAVVDEVIRTFIETTWIAPLAEAQDPIAGLQSLLAAGRDHLSETAVLLGCPLTNLAQEMSGIDEGFRTRIAAIYDRWREALAATIDRGQRRGTVDAALDPRRVADFFVVVLEGALTLAKNRRDPSLIADTAAEFARYLETLRRVG